MTPRERVMTALNKKEPDRPPLMTRPCDEMLEYIKPKIKAGEDWRAYLGDDIYLCGFEFPEYQKKTLQRYMK